MTTLKTYDVANIQKLLRLYVKDEFSRVRLPKLKHLSYKIKFVEIQILLSLFY